MIIFLKILFFSLPFS